MLHVTLMFGLLATAEAGALDRMVVITEVEDEAARAVASSVEVYVTDRIRDAWGIEPSSSVTENPDGRQFEVILSWERPDEVTIRISEGSEILVARPVAVEEPDAARALVWLLVRSTVERVVLRADQDAVIGPAAVDPTDAPTDSATDPGSREVADVEVLGDDDVDPLLPPPEPELQTPAPDAEAANAALSVPDAAAAEPAAEEPPVQARTDPKPKVRPDADVISVGLVARGYADTGSGLATGPALQLRLRLREWLHVGLELGVRTEDREVLRDPAPATPETLEIRHVPLTLTAGLQPLKSLPLEFGAGLTVDMRRVTTSETSGTTAGVMLGVYSRAFWDFWTGDRNSVALFGDLTLSVPAVRQAYLVGDTREEDGLVVLGLGAGLEWRWH